MNYDVVDVLCPSVLKFYTFGAQECNPFSVRNEHGNWNSFLPSAGTCDVVSSGFVIVTGSLNVRSHLLEV